MNRETENKFDKMLLELEELNQKIEGNKLLLGREELDELKGTRRKLVKQINTFLEDEKIPQDSLVTISVNNTLKND